jgi:hypothetical protein
MRPEPPAATPIVATPIVAIRSRRIVNRRSETTRVPRATKTTALRREDRRQF